MADPSSPHELAPLDGKPPPSERYVESEINLSLLDPPRWGWTAGGGIVDVLTPHEVSSSALCYLTVMNYNAYTCLRQRARRRSTKKRYLTLKRKRDAAALSDAAAGGSAVAALPHVAMNGEGPSPKATGGDQLIQPTVGLKKPPPVSVKATEPPKPFRFSAWNSNARILDIFTYHRGREGVEIRDEQSGDLMCDMEPTDSNFGLDEPKMVAQVTIQFPLEDHTDDQNARYYRDSIAWDLSDVETPTPMAFASNLALEVGLSYRQTVELAESIQSQLQSFVRDNCAYNPAVVLKDMYGNPREAPPRRAFALYGEATGPEPPGTRLQSSWARPRASVRLSTVPKPALRTSVVEKKAPSQKAPAKSRQETSATLVAAPKAKPNYRGEVQQRLRAESSRRIQLVVVPGKLVGEITMAQGLTCHLCLEQREKCGIFPCHDPYHAMCEAHLSSCHGLSLQSDPVPPLLDHCPICSLTCACKVCAKRLDAVAKEFRETGDQQDAGSVGEIVFENLFDYAATLEVAPEGDKKVDRRRQKRSFSQIRSVKKVAPSEFPREVCEGVEVEPGTEVDYRTIFSAAGAAIIPLANEDNAPSARDSADGPAQVVEDGSIDYCMACRKFGDLLCCDFCPRAFHADCIKSLARIDQSDAPWQCPRCASEKEGLADEKLTGGNSLPLICNAFNDFAEKMNHYEIGRLAILSIIHEMVLKLLDYDFGYVFSQPVDPKQVPEYPKIVKKPMDLGTIAKQLVNGTYKSRFKGKLSLDEVVAAVLCDIELVWHNCFLFNLAGSSIYRMAEVQSRAARRMQEKSFDAVLTAEVKKSVASFKNACAHDRSRATNRSVARPPSLSRRKITVPKKGQSRRRKPVAVLDPDTGRIVKIYTAVSSCIEAARFLLKLGHPCEWDTDHLDLLQRMKRIVVEGSKNPKLLMFGYRWVNLENLRAGQVAFPDGPTSVPTMVNAPPVSANSDDHTAPTAPAPEKTFNMIEVVEGEKTFIYSSLDEALTHPTLTVSREEAEQHLNMALPPTGDYIAYAGLMWRRLLSEEDARESITLAPALTTSSSSTDDAREMRVTMDFYKEDLIAAKKLQEFETLGAAYEDWLLALDSSPSALDESRSVDVFQTFYLDGERNVDGQAWKTTSANGKKPENILKTSNDGNVAQQRTNGLTHASETARSCSANSENNQGHLVSASNGRKNSSTEESPSAAQTPAVS